eukprot:COSAG05_NODE_177_length_14916_cov_8.104002_16_plen_62_part_00
MKNYQKLFKKVASWIKPGGAFFTHIFTHKLYAYHYEAASEADWMTKCAHPCPCLCTTYLGL